MTPAVEDLVGAGETPTRQIDHAPERAADVTDEAPWLVDETLPESGLDAPRPARPRPANLLRVGHSGRPRWPRADDLRPRRRHGALDGTAARVRDRLVVVASKSEDGHAAADRILAELGQSTISLGKYRTGIDLLVERDRSGEVDAVRPVFTAPA
jgi:hypothetical protein